MRLSETKGIDINMKFTAVGDALIQKRFPGEYNGFNEIREFISKGDFRFFNLETTINDGDCFASQFCGGSYLRTDAVALDDLKRYGFNMTSICNNHAMDFSYKGFLSTLDAIKKHNFIQAGAGRNMSEATAPAYLDTIDGRIAMIGVTTSFNAATKAGYQSRRFPGRPGVNGMRYDEIYEIDHEHMISLKEIAELTQINGRNQLRRKEGYLEDVHPEEFDFKTLRFVEGNHPGRRSILDEKEFARIEKSIYEAKAQADYIIVSLHNHQVRNGIKEQPDFFIEEFAHRCIDIGVHAVIGHGPHILRGIEIYKDCPIFYSLGNFIFHNENIPYAPEEFYAMYNLDSNCTMRELFDKRDAGHTKGLQTQQDVFESIIPYWEMKNGKLSKLILMPIELGKKGEISHNGWPKKSETSTIIERVKKLSDVYETTIEYKDGFGKVIL